MRTTIPSTFIRLSKNALMFEQRAAVKLFRNMALIMAQRLPSVENEIILHKTVRYPASQ